MTGTENGGQRPEAGGRKTEDGGRGTEDGGRRTGDGGRRTARSPMGQSDGSGRCTWRHGARGQTVVGGRLPMDFGLGYRSPSTHYPLLPTRYCGGRSEGVRLLHVAAGRTRSADRGRRSVADRFGTGGSSTVYSLPATAYLLRQEAEGRDGSGGRAFVCAFGEGFQALRQAQGWGWVRRPEAEMN